MFLPLIRPIAGHGDEGRWAGASQWPDQRMPLPAQVTDVAAAASAALRNHISPSPRLRDREVLRDLVAQ